MVFAIGPEEENNAAKGEVFEPLDTKEKEAVVVEKVRIGCAEPMSMMLLVAGFIIKLISTMTPSVANYGKNGRISQNRLDNNSALMAIKFLTPTLEAGTPHGKVQSS